MREFHNLFISESRYCWGYHFNISLRVVRPLFHFPFAHVIRVYNFGAFVAWFPYTDRIRVCVLCYVMWRRRRRRKRPVAYKMSTSVPGCDQGRVIGTLYTSGININTLEHVVSCSDTTHKRKCPVKSVNEISHTYKRVCVCEYDR